MPNNRTVTEVARNFSEFINRVLFRRERFVLFRGKRPVAELRPVQPTVRLCDLPALFQNLPKLDQAEAAAFDADIRKARAHLNRIPPREHWDR